MTGEGKLLLLLFDNNALLLLLLARDVALVIRINNDDGVVRDQVVSREAKKVAIKSLELILVIFIFDHVYDLGDFHVRVDVGVSGTDCNSIVDDDGVERGEELCYIIQMAAEGSLGGDGELGNSGNSRYCTGLFG